MLSIVSEEFAVSRRSQIVRALKSVELSLGLAVIAGCATPPAYPSRTATACRSHETKEGLTVGIQPLFDKQELDQYFGTDLVSRGLLPVLVVAENDSGDASYLLSLTNCSLSQGKGYGSEEDLSSRNYALIVPGGLIGAALVLDAQSKRVGMAVKELRDQTVSPGQTEQGFVYFSLPEQKPSRGSQVLVKVRVPRIGSHQTLEFELPFVWER